MTTSELPCTAADLAGYLRSQRLAYACATHVESQLEAGMTEIQAADLMRAYMIRHDIRHYFHAPFVWFGDRTELALDWSDEEFLPSQRRLVQGMPVILDVAPIVDGYASDIGYTFAFGGHPVVEAMLADLEVYRNMIPRLLKAGATMQQVYRTLDQQIAAAGYRSSHHAYPAGVIGHRVSTFAPGIGDEALTGGFGKSAFHYLKDKKEASRHDPLVSPYWNGCDQSAHAPEAGLWAVEPHIARGGIGVKFEELLVVTEGDAYWLDPEPPHVQRWRLTAGAGSGRGASVSAFASEPSGREA